MQGHRGRRCPFTFKRDASQAFSLHPWDRLLPLYPCHRFTLPTPQTPACPKPHRCVPWCPVCPSLPPGAAHQVFTHVVPYIRGVTPPAVGPQPDTCTSTRTSPAESLEAGKLPSQTPCPLGSSETSGRAVLGEAKAVAQVAAALAPGCTLLDFAVSAGAPPGGLWASPPPASASPDTPCFCANPCIQPQIPATPDPSHGSATYTATLILNPLSEAKDRT